MACAKYLNLPTNMAFKTILRPTNVNPVLSHDDSALLAAPAKRADGGRVTPGAKGKVYYPEKSDSRGMGARQRSMKSHWSAETASSTPRNIFKGGNELRSLARGIYENNELRGTNYTEDEKRVEEISAELKNLLSSLEEKKDDK